MTNPTARDNDPEGEEEVIIWTAEEAERATGKEVIEYINDRKKEYETMNLHGIELFEYWRADFENFGPTTYKRTTDRTRVLRDYLLSRGVWIPKNRKPIADNLITSAKSWTPWPASSEPQIQTQNQPRTPTITRPQTPIEQQPTSPLQNPDTRPRGRGRATHQDLYKDDEPRREQGHNLITLTKLYTEEKKYSGEGDSFDYKYGIFINLCKKAELPKEMYFKAFSIMLKGAALKHYYTTCKSNPRMTQLVDLCYSIRNTFEGPEYKQSKLSKWNLTTL